jgi:predicted nucleic acid-binding Zn ribbon protein
MNCPVCLTTFPDSEGPGRPRKFCSDRCRNRRSNEKRMKLVAYARAVRSLEI